MGKPAIIAKGCSNDHLSAANCLLMADVLPLAVLPALAKSHHGMSLCAVADASCGLDKVRCLRIPRGDLLACFYLVPSGPLPELTEVLSSTAGQPQPGLGAATHIDKCQQLSPTKAFSHFWFCCCLCRMITTAVLARLTAALWKAWCTCHATWRLAWHCSLCPSASIPKSVLLM